MAFAWLESRNSTYDYDMATHSLSGALRLGNVEEGCIHRGMYNLQSLPASTDSNDLLFLTTANSDQRRRIARKINFNWAGKGNVKEIGKASSAFLYLRNSKLVVDYIVENASHVRDGAPVLHDVLRQHIDYSNPEIKALMSGHIVPLNITNSNVGWLMSLDLCSGSDAKREYLELSVIFNTLAANRIIPITTDGYLI